MSVKMVSGPSIWEEWKDEDLDDFEPDSSGGEFGVEQRVVMISCGSIQARKSFANGIGFPRNHTQIPTYSRTGWVRIVEAGGRGRDHARLGPGRGGRGRCLGVDSFCCRKQEKTDDQREESRKRIAGAGAQADDNQIKSRFAKG